MRISTVLATLLLSLWPLAALAQGTEFQGLDLTEEPKKEEPAKEEERPTLPPEPEPAVTTSAPEKGADARMSEVEIANEDRVKSVQRKAFLKTYRLELTPMGFLTLNDSFYSKFGPGGRLAFFFADNLGLGLRFNQYNIRQSSNVRIAKRELQSKLPTVHPKYSFDLDVLWSPIYGKVAFFNSIRTFDLYVIGGAGMMNSQTSSTDGFHLSTHLGIGQRFAPLDFFAIDLSLIETMYSDRPDAKDRSVLQHLLSVNLGFSFFVPFSFEYKEP